MKPANTVSHKLTLVAVTMPDCKMKGSLLPLGTSFPLNVPLDQIYVAAAAYNSIVYYETMVNDR
jgi:hypothetical protein